MPTGMPDGAQGGPPEDQGGGDLPESSLDLLSLVRDALMKYLMVEEDDVDKKAAAALLKGVQDLFAKDQQDEEAASGTTPAMRGMRKALAR